VVKEAGGRPIGDGACKACAGTGPCVAVGVTGGGTFGAGEGMSGAATGVRREFRAAGLRIMAREVLRGMEGCTPAPATLSSERKADGGTLSFVTGVDALFPAAPGVTDGGLLPAYLAGRGLSHRPMSRASKTHPAAITQAKGRRLLSLFFDSFEESRFLSVCCKGSTETSCAWPRAGRNGSIEGLDMAPVSSREGARFLLSARASREWRASIRKRSRQ